MLNQKFGLWTVIGDGEIRGKNTHFLCRCECGNEKLVRGDALRRGKTRGCRSCRASESYVKPKSYPPGPRGFARYNPRKTHGLSGTRVYRIWKGMLRRVRLNEHGYGKFDVHERWKPENNGFLNFLEDMGEPPSNVHTLDRINNARGYEPGNCRWATYREQARNRQYNRCVEIDGNRLLVVEAEEIYGVARNLIYARLNRGWTGRQAVGLEEHSPFYKGGERCYNSRLTLRDATAIYKRIRLGVSSRRAEARHHKVSYWTVCDIMQGKTWAEIPRESIDTLAMGRK